MLKKSSALFLALTLCFASCLAQSGFAVEAEYDDDDYEFDYNDDDEYAEDEDFDDDSDFLEQAETKKAKVEDVKVEEADEEDENEEFKIKAQEKIDELQKKYNELEKKSKATQKDLNAQKTKREYAEKKQQAIATQIDSVVEQISLLERKQKLLEKEIGKKEAELKETQKHVQSEYKFLSKRFRSNYINGGYQDTAHLGLLFGVEDFFDVLTNEEFQKRIISKDREIVERLKAEEKKLAEEKEKLEVNIAELARTKATIAEKKKQLDVEYNVSSNQVYNLKLLEERLRANYKEYMKQEEEYQREISRILSQLKSMSDKYVGGQLAWPVPGYYDIYSPFGYRDWGNGFTDYHGGIDIAGAGIYGKNVIAANSGKVVYVNYTDSKGYGSYGKYIMIDHGGGIITLYGHLSAINVDQDQMVVKGQKIGEVGATGYVKGPHLHFEVRENGKRVNPEPYLS